MKNPDQASTNSPGLARCDPERHPDDGRPWQEVWADYVKDMQAKRWSTVEFRIAAEDGEVTALRRRVPNRIVEQIKLDALTDNLLAAFREEVEEAVGRLGEAHSSNGAKVPSALGSILGRELLSGVVAAAHADPRLVEPLRRMLGNGQEEAPPALLMRKAAYAERIAVGVRKLDDLIKQGLPTKGKGRMVRVKVKEGDRWVEDHLDDIDASEDEIEQLANAGADRLAQGVRD